MDTEKLVKRIKLLLGGSVLRLEITDEEITELIEMAYDVIKPYVVDRKMITCQSAPRIDMRESKVIEVLRVFPAGTLVPGPMDLQFDFQAWRVGSRDSLQGIIDTYETPSYDIRFDFQEGFLYINMDTAYSGITAECIVDVPLVDLVDERVIAWLQKYSLALCKETVGRIRSKFKSSNIPVELDGDTLLSEASQSKDQLEAELQEKDFGSSFLLR